MNTTLSYDQTVDGLTHSFAASVQIFRPLIVEGIKTLNLIPTQDLVNSVIAQILTGAYLKIMESDAALGANLADVHALALSNLAASCLTISHRSTVADSQGQKL